MAGGDPDDIRRSLRRYVWQMLGGAPWTVRLQRTRIADDERPAAVIDPQTRTTLFSRAGNVHQGDVQRAWPFTIVCYPELENAAAASNETAQALATLLEAGFSRGLVTDDAPPVTIGAPWRLPVYDFAGVAIAGPDRAGPTEPYMHANVDDRAFTIRPIQDAMDELRYTVVCSIRVTWWAGGRVPPSGPTVTSMPGTFSVTPP